MTVLLDVPLKLLSTTNDPNKWPNNGNCYGVPDTITLEEVCPDGVAPGSDGCFKLCPDKVSIIDTAPTIFRLPDGNEYALEPFFADEDGQSSSATKSFWAPEGKETVVDIGFKLVPVQCLPPGTPTKAPAEVVPASAP